MEPVLPPVEVAWSGDVSQASWIAEALRPLGDGVGSVVPRGYPAYVRVEHGPGETGSLGAADLDALLSVLGPASTTPDCCWFCLWSGYGWVEGGRAVSALSGRQQRRGQAVPGAVPPAVAAGPKVRLPGREYLLFSGRVDQAAAWMSHPYRQSPNLWWPHDQAWVVATEIDLPCTLVGGTEDVARQLLASPDLRVTPATIDDPLG